MTPFCLRAFVIAWSNLFCACLRGHGHTCADYGWPTCRDCAEYRFAETFPPTVLHDALPTR